MEHKESRDRDLLRCIDREKRRLLNSGVFTTINAAIRAAVEAPAPGYYIGFDYALRCVSELRRGAAAPSRLSRRGCMLAEILGKCETTLAEHPGLSLNEALARVLTSQTASSFFISFAQARKIYFASRHDHRLRGHRLRGRRLF